MVVSMQLAGIPIRDAAVLELARVLRDGEFVDVAAKIERGYDAETKVLVLTWSIGSRPSIRQDREAGAHVRPAIDFVSNALAAGITVYELARIMGTSVSMIEAHYGALLARRTLDSSIVSRRLGT